MMEVEMPEDVYSSNHVKIVREENLGNMEVVKMFGRKSDVRLTILVSDSQIIILSGRNNDMKVVSHGGSPAIQVTSS